MKTLESKRAQVARQIRSLQADLEFIDSEIAANTLNRGDIVLTPRGKRRVILNTGDGDLGAFRKDDELGIVLRKKVGNFPYTKTGENIFLDNDVDIDY